MIFRVSFWEIPGKERHLSFMKNYCLGAAVAIILFDTTKNHTLEKAEKILKSIESCDIPIKLLICNKMDLLSSKKILLVLLFNKMLKLLLKIISALTLIVTLLLEILLILYMKI
jgi:signal recognition particle receptor subunit beta